MPVILASKGELTQARERQIVGQNTIMMFQNESEKQVEKEPPAEGSNVGKGQVGDYCCCCSQPVS